MAQTGSTYGSRGVEAYNEGAYSKAADIWLTEAYEGSMEAAFNLGVLFLEGKGVEQDRDEAIFWFIRAAENDHLEALYNLGHLYVENVNDPQSVAHGVSLWKRASEAGFLIAQFNYARALFLGFGVEQDIELAKFWFEQAAAEGEVYSQSFLSENAQTFYGEVSLENTHAVSVISDQPASHDADELDKDDLPNTISESIEPDQTEIIASSDILSTDVGQESTHDIEVEIVERSSDASEAPTQTESASVMINSLNPDEQPENFVGEQVEISHGSSPIERMYIIKQTPSFLYDDYQEKSEVVFSLASGTLVKSVETREARTKIRIPAGLPLWVKKKKVSINGTTVLIEDDGVKARANIKSRFGVPVLAEFDRGLKMSLVEIQKSWVRVLAPDWVTAWVDSANLMDYEVSERQQSIDWDKQVANLLSTYRRASSDQISVTDRIDNTESNVELTSSLIESQDESESQAGSAVNWAGIDMDVESLPVATSILQSTQRRPGMTSDNSDPRLDNYQWLFAQNDSEYTLRLFTVRESGDVDHLIKDEEGLIWMFSTFFDSRSVYDAFYGIYVNRTAAESDRLNLPVWAENSEPITFEELKANVCATENVRTIDQADRKTELIDLCLIQ